MARFGMAPRCAAVVGILCGMAVPLLADEVSYSSKGRRDPFIPILGKNKTERAGLQDVTSVKEIILEGIAVGPKGNNIAVMNGVIVKKGDVYGNLEIKAIDKKSVSVVLDGIEYGINLQEEGGTQSGKS